MSSIVVVDVELFTNGVVKEIGIYKNGAAIGLSFLPPYIMNFLSDKEKRQCAWLTNNLHNIEWNSGEIPYHHLQETLDIVTNSDSINFFTNPNGSTNNYYVRLISDCVGWNVQKAPADIKFFSKGIEKCKLLESIFNRKFYDIADYGCPKLIDVLIDPSKLCKCDSYPEKHAKVTTHCAQKKAFFMGTWLQKHVEDNWFKLNLSQ